MRPGGHRRWRASIVAVGVLVTLVGAELIARVATNDAPRPLVWSNYEAQYKAKRMDELRIDGTSVPVVFVGSSTMNAAADPRLIDGETRTRSFNAALQGMDLRAMGFWIENVVVPRLRPEVIVVGVTSREFNDRGRVQQRLFEALSTSKAAKQLLGTETAAERVERWLNDHVALFGYRSYLRTPTHVLDGDPDVERGEIDTVGNLDAMRSRQGRDYEFFETLRRNEKDTYNDFTVGGVQVRALDRLVTNLDRRGIETILVKLPVTDDILEVHPNGRADFRSYEESLERFVERRDVTFVNADAAITERRYFADPHHLGDDGMREFAELIAPYIERAVR